MAPRKKITEAFITVIGYSPDGSTVTVSLTARAATRAKIAQWHVAWGDGQFVQGSGPPPLLHQAHTYSASKNYTITLTVWDTIGGKAEAKAVVGVIIYTQPSPAPAGGGCDFTSDGSYSDTDAKVALASAGQTVCIPAGTFTWGSALSVDKSITLQGLGSNRGTKAQCEVGSQTTYTCIKGNNQLLAWDTPSTGEPMLAGISFYGDSCAACSNSGAYGIGHLNISGSNGQFRMHDVVVDTGGTAYTGLIIQDYVRGVGWDCDFVQRGQTDHAALVLHNAWMDTGSNGDKSWAEASSIGTTEAWYWEACTFGISGFASQGYCTDDFQGARVTYRFNTLTNCSLQNHGTETGGRFRGYREVDYYKNTATNNLVAWAGAFAFRGGNGYAWGNTFTTSGSGSYPQTTGGTTFRRDDLSHGGIWYPWGGMGTQDVLKIVRVGGSGTTVIATMDGVEHKIHGSSSADSFYPNAGSYVTIDAPSDAAQYSDTFWALGLSQTISSVGTGNPATVTTSAAHNFETGDTVWMGNVLLTPDLSADITSFHTITVTGATTFTIPVNVTSGCANATACRRNGSSAAFALNRRKFTFSIASDPGSNATGSDITLNSPFDANVDATGWRGLDAFGAGTSGVYISGDGPPFGGMSPLTGHTPTGQPVYNWLDRLNGSQSDLQVTVDFAQENRDYFLEQSSFDGTAGIGVGTIASRPATCTVGVAYWATDEGTWNANEIPSGKRYECTATNTWTAKYGANSSGEPLAYPHPYRSL